MNVNSFRQIGYIYAVLCFIVSSLGAIYFFRKIFEPQSFCNQFFCGSGFNHPLVSATGVVMCLVSATFTILVKLGIEQGEVGYIQISRTFMLVRSMVLTMRWTYESVALTTLEIARGVPREDDKLHSTATILLIFITALTGLEMWILDGVHKYSQQRIQEDSVRTNLTRVAHQLRLRRNFNYN